MKEIPILVKVEDYQLLNGLNLYYEEKLLNQEREYTSIREAFSKVNCVYHFDGVVHNSHSNDHFVEKSKLVSILCSMDNESFNCVCAAMSIPDPVVFFRNWWIERRNNPSACVFSWVKALLEYVQLGSVSEKAVVSCESKGDLTDRKAFLQGYVPTFNVKNRAWIGEFRNVDDILEDFELMRRVRIAVHLLANRFCHSFTGTLLADRNRYYFYQTIASTTSVISGRLESLQDMSYCFIRSWNDIVERHSFTIMEFCRVFEFSKFCEIETSKLQDPMDLKPVLTGFRIKSKIRYEISVKPTPKEVKENSISKPKISEEQKKRVWKRFCSVLSTPHNTTF